MTWIKTIPPDQADETLINAFMDQAKLYPKEYAVRVDAAEQFSQGEAGAGIVNSHSLLPATLYHAFATYGTLLSPDLPLRRHQHEMIAATVSSLNRCFY